MLDSIANVAQEVGPLAKYRGPQHTVRLTDDQQMRQDLQVKWLEAAVLMQEQKGERYKFKLAMESLLIPTLRKETP